MFIVWVVHTRLARDERARSGHKIYNMRSRQRDAMRERIHVHVFARERTMHFDIDFNLLIRSERRRGECVCVCKCMKSTRLGNMRRINIDCQLFHTQSFVPTTGEMQNPLINQVCVCVYHKKWRGRFAIARYFTSSQAQEKGVRPAHAASSTCMQKNVDDIIMIERENQKIPNRIKTGAMFP